MQKKWHVQWRAKKVCIVEGMTLHTGNWWYHSQHSLRSQARAVAKAHRIQFPNLDVRVVDAVKAVHAKLGQARLSPSETAL